MATTPTPPAPVSDDDSRLLAELGYKQELHRGLSGFSNFAVSFSIISILAGCITSYLIAMNAGGPVAISIGWPLVGLFVLCVALAMGEVCSVYPTAGGLYYWAGRLAKRNKRVWAWYVGWFNFLGEVAVTAAIDFGAAVTWMAFVNLVAGVDVTAGRTFLMFLLIIGLHGALNTFGVDLVRLLSNISAWWHLVGVAVIVAVLIVVPDHHQSMSFTFFHFENRTGWDFGGASIYVFLIGLLMAQYTYTGYDASAHIAEETRSAASEAPKGIVRSVWVSILAGWVLLVAVTAAIQSYDGALNSATGLPPAQIFIDSAGRHTGEFLLLICCVAQFFCGMASVTANSRMSYAFSRDGALPGSTLWARVNPNTGTPTNSIWLCVVLSSLLVLPSLWSITAYLAVTSIAVIGLYIAYATPVLLRRLIGDDFKVGPWNLGRWSAPIGWIAIVWVAFIVILFMLPPASPIDVNTFNYAPIAVVAVLVFATASWIVGGRQNFMRHVPPGHDTKDPSGILAE